jgi:hypothetical protein
MRASIGLVALVTAGAANAQEAPICTDRPAKANAVCTVPAGRFQIETALLGWSRLDDGGARLETLYVGASALKYGLSGRSDLQLGVSPLVRIQTDQDGDRSTLSGVGDLVVRYKHRITADGTPVQVALIPFVKLPTARRGIGNREWEGGVAAAVSVPVGKATVTFGPEADLLADGAGHGRHVALVNLINLSASVAPRLSLAGELWTNINYDPAGTLRQASADLALAYAMSDDFQLDAGANAGLTKATADIELYAGASFRF